MNCANCIQYVLLQPHPSVFLPNVMTVGASGAVFGLFGAVWADFFQNYDTNRYSYVSLTSCQRTRALLSLAFCTVLALAMGLLPFVDNFAHVGGFIGGLLAGLVLLTADDYANDDEEGGGSGPYDVEAGGGVCCRGDGGGGGGGLCCCCFYCPSDAHSSRQVAVSVLAGLVLAAYVAVLYSSLFEGNNIHTQCSWCESINCLVSIHKQELSVYWIDYKHTCMH